MNTKYTHLLFDLDHTLWDFDSNCKATLQNIHKSFSLVERGINFEEFYTKYVEINNLVWGLYDKNKITKVELRNYRFQNLLSFFGINDKLLANEIENNYISNCPKNGILLPFAEQLISITKDKFNINIISNGFQEIQEIKINHSKLKGCFENIYTSESCAYKKPDPRFFDYVLQELNTTKNKCLVIGDNPHTDILGANNSQIDSLWVNTQTFKKTINSTYYVKSIEEAIRLFRF